MHPDVILTEDDDSMSARDLEEAIDEGALDDFDLDDIQKRMTEHLESVLGPDVGRELVTAVR